MLNGLPAQKMISRIHYAGIEAEVSRSEAELGIKRKEALYSVILAAQAADCPALAAAACHLYETSPDDTPAAAPAPGDK